MAVEIVRLDPAVEISSTPRGETKYRTRAHLSESTRDEALVKRLVIAKLGEYKHMLSCEIQFPYDCVLVIYSVDSGD